MSFSYGDQVLCPVYITIKNLNANTWQTQNWLKTLLLSFILIIYEQSKKTNNKNKNLKAKIYHMALRIIL